MKNGYLKIAKLIHKAHQLENKEIPAKQLPPLKDIAETARKNYLESTGKTQKDLDGLESRAEKYAVPKKLKTH